MQPLAIRILYVALIAVYGISSAGGRAKYPHGGFEPRLDKLQGLLDYVAKKIDPSRSQVMAHYGHWPVATAQQQSLSPPSKSRPARLTTFLSPFPSLAMTASLPSFTCGASSIKNMKATLRSESPKGTRPLTSSKPCTRRTRRPRL